MADIIQVIVIVVNFAQNARHAPVHDELIELLHLSVNIKHIVLSILVIDSTHNHLEFVDILVIDQILLGPATEIDLLTDGFLEGGHIAGRKEVFDR